MTVLTRRVQRGLELLDREMPGWAQFMDADRLDLALGNRCILGQLYSGHYDMGEAVLFGRGRSAREATNDARRHGFYQGLFSTNHRLTLEWAKIILIRQYDAEQLNKTCPAKAAATEAP